MTTLFYISPDYITTMTTITLFTLHINLLISAYSGHLLLFYLHYGQLSLLTVTSYFIDICPIYHLNEVDINKGTIQPVLSL
jgi:hypothetical protein